MEKQDLYFLAFLALIFIPLHNQSIENRKHNIQAEKRADLKLKKALIGLTREDIKPINYDNCFKTHNICHKKGIKPSKDCAFQMLKCFEKQNFQIKINYELEKL